MSLGVQELLIPLGILAVILLLGARKFGEIGSGLGEGIRNFRKSLKSEEPKDGSGESQGPQNR